MTEEQHRKWDIIIKAVITPIIAVITVLVGIYQYTDAQKQSLEREYELKRLERQEKRFEEKAALYKETRQLLSFLSTNDSKTSDIYETKRNKFWELYWGDLASVETHPIESLMVQFGNKLDQIKNEKDEAKINSIKNELQQISLSFAHQTKKELNED